MTQWSVEQIPDLTGKVALVTGGNSGIGLLSCKHLLKNNAKVYIASRDSQKSLDALATLKTETGKEAILLPVDLANLASVRKCAESFLSKEEKLDILMNNAGIGGSPDKLTVDGYNIQFGVNVLAHFHLTMILLPALLKSPGARVVNVTSDGHSLAPKVGIQFEDLKGEKNPSWIPLKDTRAQYTSYGQSKLGNILFSSEFHRQFHDKGLVSISVHPGIIETPLYRFNNRLTKAILSLFTHPPEYGCVTQLYAACAPEASEHSGQYLIPQAQVGKPTNIANDEKLAKKLWEWCEEELKAF